MLRFLKKRWEQPRKSSQKPVPLENPTQQIIDTSADWGVDSDGEYRLRQISELMKPMGLIRLSGRYQPRKAFPDRDSEREGWGSTASRVEHFNPDSWVRGWQRK